MTDTYQSEGLGDWELKWTPTPKHLGGGFTTMPRPSTVIAVMDVAPEWIVHITDASSSNLPKRKILTDAFDEAEAKRQALEFYESVSESL